MTLTNKGKIFLSLLIISAVLSYLLVSFIFFPFTGVALSFLLGASYLFFRSKSTSLRTKSYYVFVVVYCVFFFLRSEIFLTLINILTLIYTVSFLILSLKNNFPANIREFLLAPLYIIIPIFFVENKYSLEFEKSKKNHTLDELKIIILTVLIVSITVPLLSSANPFFADMVNNVLQVFKINSLLNLFKGQAAIISIFRILFFGAFLITLPRLLTFSETETGKTSRLAEKNHLNLLIPKVVLIILLLIFFATQIRLYFSSDAVLQALGISHSQYTREVFGQLAVVSIIISLLIYNDKKYDKNNKLAIRILVVEGMFLILMALKSVFDYSSTFGFTYKRLYGFVAVVWATGLMITLFKQYLKPTENSILLHKISVLTLCCLALINISNFDYLIYHFRKSNLGSQIDYRYLSQLSADSLSYRQQLSENENRFNDLSSDNEMKFTTAISLGSLISKTEYLQQKYTKLDFKTFSLLEYLQYRDVKDINTTEIKNKIIPFQYPLR